MSYIEKLVERKFRDGETVEVDAKELQRLASYAIRKECEVSVLKAKLAGYEIVERKEKIKLYA